MITYEYSEYFPDDDDKIDKEKLMSILSDMIMKYDINLEEALRLLIERGGPVNLFLKEGGMDSLIENFKNQIDEKIKSILDEFQISHNIDLLKKEINSDKKEIEKKIIDKDLANKIISAIDKENTDEFRRIKWKLQSEKKFDKKLDEILFKLNDLSIIQNGEKKYKFKGKTKLNVPESIELIHALDQLSELLKTLNDSLETGDLYNFNLEQLAKYLGQESYNEFLERREKIFEQLKELLKQGGNIQESEDGEISLSPNSIRKIGMRALTEIFSNMKSDSSSGSHKTNEFGDSENITSSTKPLEFGDNLSHLDFTGSIINSHIRGNGNIPSLKDMEVFQARGSSKSATVILLDMSGSMARSSRFYNAKKMTLAMDSLIRNEYKDEKLTLVGFGSTAKIIPIPDVPSLQPYPVTIFDPYIKLKFDFSKLTKEQIQNRVPEYFTNLQKGLSVARQALSSKQTKNKQIFLITDGAPTAHFKGSVLHINYPPTPADFDEALTEVKRCKEDGIVINTFLLTSEWDYNYFGEKSFINQFAKIAEGRIFYPHPNELNQMIIYDFIQNKKKKFSY